VARIKSHEHSAFEYLYDHYSGALYGVVFRILKQDKIAEEVLQDVFLKVWDRIDQYDVSRGRLFTWLVNIARNLAIDKIRSKEISRERKTNRLDGLVDTIDVGHGVELKTDDIGIREVLKVLPEEQQFVVEYLYFHGYSQSELAEDFNIPLGTIKTRLRAALQKLRLTFA
jgi:RNA polymerase sigma factor (sigma-70 family)